MCKEKEIQKSVIKCNNNTNPKSYITLQTATCMLFRTAYKTYI